MANGNLKETIDLAKELNLATEMYGKRIKRQDSTLKDRAKILQDSIAAQGDSNKLAEIQESLDAKIQEHIKKGNVRLAKRYELEKEILGLAQEEAKVQEKVNDALIDAADGLGLPASKLKQMYETLNQEGGKQLIQIAIAAAIIGGMISLVNKVAEATDEVGNRFGAIGTTSFNADLQSAKATAVGLGFSFDDMADSVEELSSNFGIAFADSIDMSKSTMDTARALGISTKLSAHLTGMLMSMNNHSAETAQNFLKQTAALAKSAGVAPGVVMQDIADASEDVAAFTKDSGENIAKAAVRARQMGINLGDVTKIARNLLDFQSSIQSELEASVLIGRQINLQKARELFLNNELEKGLDAVIDQLGSAEEFNKMNVIQRDALAKAVGVELSVMQKLVNEQGKSRQELARMRELDLSEIASEEALSNITLMLNTLKGIGVQMLSLIAGVVAWFDSFGEGWGTVGTILLVMSAVLLGVALYLGMTYLSGLAAGAGLKAAGIGGKAAGVGLGALAAGGTAAIPILLAIALVGATIVGILYGIGYIVKQVAALFAVLPPVIEAVAAGFVTISEAIVNGLLALVKPDVLLGIYALAGGFMFLAAALGMLAIAGFYAMPALAAVALFAAGMSALGYNAEMVVNLVHGPGTSPTTSTDDPLLKAVEGVKTGIDNLVKGFGGEPSVDGQYITKFALAIPREVGIKSNFGLGFGTK